MAEWQDLPFGLMAKHCRAKGAGRTRHRLGVLIPRTRAAAGLAFALLCAAYLPLHVWDFFRPDPVFPVPWGTGARIMVQLGLIWLGVWVWRDEG